jgi:uncharacterized membrane protein YhaH (DUF805 family)
MRFTQAVTRVYKGSLDFNGRASRSEYWWYCLFYQLVGIAVLAIEVSIGLGQVDFVTAEREVGVVIGSGPLSLLWLLVNIVPGTAAAVRRMHDTDRPGSRVWIVLVPIVGVILLVAWAAERGTPGANRFGTPAAPDPTRGTGVTPA